jgi:hypothetical protein
VSLTLTQRWNRGRDSYRPAGEPIRTLEYEVAAVDEASAKAFVCTHHYSRAYPAARFRFGLFCRGELVGVAVGSQPMTDAVLTNVFAIPVLELTELGRFVLLDAVPANGETFFLGRCWELLRREGLAGVVSFSDPMPRRRLDGTLGVPGHVGLIYQAHNATFLGRATARTLRVLPDATVLSDRTLQKIRCGDRGWRYAVDQLVRHGAPDVYELRRWLPAALERTTRRLRHHGNYRYAWALTRSARRLLPRGLSYPKRIDPEQLPMPSVA